MEDSSKKAGVKGYRDRIEGDKIILSGEGSYPKDVIITDRFGRMRKYLLKKTLKGGYLLI